jgi:hypothetical protein
MNPPPFEVVDIIRAAGKSFVEKDRSRLNWQHLRVLRAIERCRTAALGGHLDQCSRCGHQAISYNSCRNRHCAKCQTNARDKWLAAREKELLAVPYVQQKLMTVTAEEFLRRVLLHVLHTVLFALAPSAFRQTAGASPYCRSANNC